LRAVLRAVRTVLRPGVFFVTIVFLPFCFDVAICQFKGALSSKSLHFF
jgi:hypothetical protein